MGDVMWSEEKMHGMVMQHPRKRLRSSCCKNLMMPYLNSQLHVQLRVHLQQQRCDCRSSVHPGMPLCRRRFSLDLVQPTCCGPGRRPSARHAWRAKLFEEPIFAPGSLESVMPL